MILKARQAVFTIFVLLCLVSKASGTTWDYQGYITGCDLSLCSVVPMVDNQPVAGFITLDVAAGEFPLPSGFNDFDLDIQETNSGGSYYGPVEAGPGPPGTTLSGTVNTDGNGDFVNASMLRGDFDAGTDLGAAGGYVDIDLVSGVATIYVSALELGFPTDYRVYVASVYGTWTRRTTPPVLDIDYDGIADDIDNCQAVYNPGQADTDKDGIGDLCEPDQDEDGINDDDDNCPTVSNPDQADINVDGFGDVCVSPDVVIPKGSDVGENVIIEEGVLLQKDSAIGDDTTIGENVSVGKGSSIGESTDISADTSLSKETEVGSQVIIGDGVLIAKGVVIGNGVIIGDNVVIRKDTIIGDGVMVGSGVLIEQNVTILDGANIDPDTTVPAGSTFPP